MVKDVSKKSQNKSEKSQNKKHTKKSIISNKNDSQINISRKREIDGRENAMFLDPMTKETPHTDDILQPVPLNGTFLHKKNIINDQNK